MCQYLLGHSRIGEMRTCCEASMLGVHALESARSGADITLKLNDSSPRGDSNRLRTVSRTEFFQDVLEMGFYRLF